MLSKKRIKELFGEKKQKSFTSRKDAVEFAKSSRGSKIGLGASTPEPAKKDPNYGIRNFKLRK